MMQPLAEVHEGVCGSICGVAPRIEGEIPPEAHFVMSALEAGPAPVADRHSTRRIRHRVLAELRLFSDRPESDPRVLYTRNVSARALAFLSDQPIPLSHGGVVLLPSLDGNMLRIFCTVLRCRPAASGWWEGAVYFNRPQEAFAAE